MQTAAQIKAGPATSTATLNTHTTRKQPLLSSTAFATLQETSPARLSTKRLEAPSADGKKDGGANTDSTSSTDSPKDDEKKKTEEEQGQDKQKKELTPEQQLLVEQLQQRDAQVRRHEQAHASVGGQYAGSPNYEYTVGPDGRRYATGGEVQIDAGKISGDPEATIRKLQVVRQSALAPADPSPQDQRVAATASQGVNEARADLRELKAQEDRDEAEEQAAKKADEKATSTKDETPAANKDTATADNEGQAGGQNTGETGNSVQFNRDGVSSAQAANAFEQAIQLTPPTTNGAEVVQDTFRAVQVTA